jgi:hypothetical protein
MKKRTLTTLWASLALLCGTVSSLSAQQTYDDKLQQDREAIKAMCGCYEVTFEFGETFAPDTNYTFKPNYRSGGLEWVTLVEDSDRKLVLQHLLIVGDNSIVKHWRQDWLYENTDLYLFDQGNHWRYTRLPKNEVRGQWTQKVFQVDDSPRYEGSATWVHVDGRHFWENTTPAPLPRREFTQRSDYNVMIRRNRHEITQYGWMHEQDNNKVLRSEAGDKLIAAEKGLNPYRKVDDSRCKPAQDWWKENQAFWAKVRTEWDALFAQNKNLELHGKLDDKPLFMHLFALPADSDQAAIRQVIQKFVKN